MKTTAKCLLNMVIMILGANLIACTLAPTQQAATLCKAPDAVVLGRAIEQAKADLATPGCEKHFDAYFQNLLAVGEGDTDVDNKHHYRGFIEWSHQQGLIGKLQGKTLYTRYFHRNFTVLPGEYNNCAATCPAITRVQRDLRQELADKQRGISRISADRDYYQLVDSDYNAVLLMLDATCHSCVADRNVF